MELCHHLLYLVFLLSMCVGQGENQGSLSVLAFSPGNKNKIDTHTKATINKTTGVVSL